MLLILIIIIVLALIYLNDKEDFVSNYYDLDWSNINEAHKFPKHKNLKYSMSCDLTDDAQPFCHNSYDVPRYDSKRKMYFSNSV